MELESHLKGEDLLVELQLMELGNVAFTFDVAQIMTPDSHSRVVAENILLVA